MKNCELNQLLTCFHSCLKLKNVLRSNFVNSERKRKESAAEHSWMLALMTMLVSPYLEPTFCLLKALKIALIHDIGESLIGDVDLLSLLKNEELKNQRYREEENAIIEIFSNLQEKEREELLSLWYDFEQRNSYEAKVVFALDKIECQLQQNSSKEDTLSLLKQSGLFDKLDPIFEFDKFIQILKNKVIYDYEEKLYEY